MSKKPLVSGWRGAAFRDVDFAKWVTSWEDTREPGGPVHRYNKRDGGEAEPMGRLPHQTVFHLAFAGSTWLADFLKLQAAIDENPLGLLVHPVYGPMTMFCRGYSGARMDIENAIDLYELALKFTESALDTRVSADDAQGPTAKQNLIAATADSLTTAAASFPSVTSQISALTIQAEAYASAAVSAASNLEPDASLSTQLATVEALTEAALDAVSSDPLAIATISPTPTLNLLEQLYDACCQMDDAVQAMRTPLFEWTVPMRMHVTNISRQFYGPDGKKREPEILTNNAKRIRDPGFIPQGTVLLMAPRTV